MFCTYINPKHDVFFNLTKYFCCLNLTKLGQKPKNKNEPNMIKTAISCGPPQPALVEVFVTCHLTTPKVFLPGRFLPDSLKPNFFHMQSVYKQASLKKPLALTE